MESAKHAKSLPGAPANCTAESGRSPESCVDAPNANTTETDSHARHHLFTAACALTRPSTRRTCASAPPPQAPSGPRCGREGCATAPSSRRTGLRATQSQRARECGDPLSCSLSEQPVVARGVSAAARCASLHTCAEQGSGAGVAAEQIVQPNLVGRERSLDQQLAPEGIALLPRGRT